VRARSSVERHRQSFVCAVLSAALALQAGLLATPARAELRPPPVELPGERPPEIPVPEERGEILPPPPEAPERPLPDLRVRVARIRIVGNTVLPQSELEAVAAPYAGRTLGAADLRTLRDALTHLYVERGYVTSGATLPDQDFPDDTIEIRIVEGRLSRLSIDGEQRFRRQYLAERIAPDLDAPLDVHELETRLQLLQRDPQIRSVHAELRPGLRLGESVLRVRVVEERGYALGAGLGNHRAPALGDFSGGVSGSLRNLTGWGDRLDGRAEFAKGLVDLLGLYEVPVTPWDTTLTPRVRWAKSRVVESPFDALDIESDFLSAGVQIEHPVVRTLADELRVGLQAEWRRGRNFVNGFGFSFSEGADRGESVVAPLRPYLEWVRRGRDQVIALRGQVSFGLPVLGATDVPGALADGTFVAGLLQGQWARRFDALWGTEALLRFDLQLASQPLPAIEQFSVGGHASVRGYRENQLVRDNGFDLSLDVRIPVWRRPDGRSILQIVPFADVGRGWDDSRRPRDSGQTLASVGLGLRWFPSRNVRAELFWGHRLVGVPDPPHETLQDEGIQFLLSTALF
jgi:hemolysin activation/secretion protein